MICEWMSVESIIPFGSYRLLCYRPKHAFSLLRVLAAALGNAYVEIALET